MIGRGILYVHWNPRSSGEETIRRRGQLYASLQSARATGLPTCLVLDARDGQTDSTRFDQVVRMPFETFETSHSHPLGRRLMGMLRTPFDQTLCLHADTRIVRPDILFPFDKLGRFGSCMAMDRHLFGAKDIRWRNASAGPFERIARALVSPRLDYLPLYNSGVIFYGRRPDTMATLELAWQLTRNGVLLEGGLQVPVSDGVALSVAIEARRDHPYGLSRVWNCVEPARGTWTAVARILHPAAVPGAG